MSQGIGIEEISHVELITKTISRLLDGAPEYHGKKYDVPGKGGDPVMDMAKDAKNPHHFIHGAQGALPVDAAGNPWSGSYVHNHGNLVLDLMDNLVLESTGRLQKCRIYQMSSNKTLRATVAILIARDEAHEMAFAKALETLGIDWGKALPIPKFDSSQYPEVEKLIDLGINREQYTFRLDGSMMDQIFKGSAPANDGTELVTLKEPKNSFPFHQHLNGQKNLRQDWIPICRNLLTPLLSLRIKRSKIWRLKLDLIPGKGKHHSYNINGGLLGPLFYALRNVGS